jgi:hypothetical protein
MRVGIMQSQGRGTPKNLEAARVNLAEAARCGSFPARLELTKFMIKVHFGTRAIPLGVLLLGWWTATSLVRALRGDAKVLAGVGR